ncbi:hypothetical protein LCGC14_2570220 [marine sediment metagenome]|uniref:Uncharacterized protein n=1 Tax=marine sediment metagenome TaxID=412755 RepID=A0A0F9CTJ7_9ZZZZ
MGLFDAIFGGPKEVRKDREGNTYEYNLSTKEIKKQNPGSPVKFRVGYAESTERFLESVDAN